MEQLVINMSKKRILILGGAGFIATNLINFFGNIDNYDVYATTHVNDSRANANVTLATNVDLTNRERIDWLFQIVKPHIVIHAAAVTTGSKDVIERPYLHVTDNLIMNSLVFEMCHKFNVEHTIFFSCTVMLQPSDKPQSESDWKIEQEPFPAYFGVANMKVASERLCEFYSRISKGKFTAIRHSNVYGPYDKFDLNKCHVLPAMIKKVTDATDKIEVWGDGQARRDLVYIDDLVDFVDKCIQKQANQYELFNCGSGRAYSIREIISAVQKATDKPNLELVYDLSKPNIPTTVMLNCEKAERFIGWKPTTPFDVGITKTVEYYKSL
jgi:GDP-L-fucose synthase